MILDAVLADAPWHADFKDPDERHLMSHQPPSGEVLVYQAPDVALSQITVGAVALPLMILLALAKVRALEGSRRRDDQ